MDNTLGVLNDLGIRLKQIVEFANKVPRSTTRNISSLVNYSNNIILFEIGSIVRSTIVPNFWSQFDIYQKGADYGSTSDFQFAMFDCFTKAVQELGNNYTALVHTLQQTPFWMHCKDSGQIIENKIRETFRYALLGQLHPYFQYVVCAFYDISFKVFSNVCLESTHYPHIGGIHLLNDNAICGGCNHEKGTCQCRNLNQLTIQVNSTLLNMELLDRISGQTITSLVQKEIQNHIVETCQGVFDKSHIKDLDMWVDGVVMHWLTRIFNKGNLEVSENDVKTKNVLQSFKMKLIYFLYENFALSLIDQFFSIIIDFPESTPAVDDLKICMEKIEIRKHLINSLTKSFEARILHPGVNTMDILTGYIAAIKTIRHLDDTGVILETVTEPIKKYLRRRSDTVRRVVTGLTEEGPTDLSEELAKAETLKETKTTNSDEELEDWETWLPDSFGCDDSSRLGSERRSGSADIISMIVDIYGSKELFMNEYRNLLADRLLAQLDFNPEKEIRNLELLKLRFGDNLLHSCEVMLKDVADSKRINAHIQSDTNYKESKQFDISTLIISAQFWPTFNKENLEIPEPIKQEFEKYTTSYEAYKGNRTLNWRNITGRVSLEIELGGCVMEFNVPPTQAVIIYHFQEKDEWSLEDLSNVMNIPPTILKKRIWFWQSRDIIKEISTGVFKLIEEFSNKASIDEPAGSTELQKEEDDLESAMASSSDQREEELQVFWSYIVGMLTNLDSLPIERIHQMLKLFASHGIGVEFSQEELKDFLQRKVREHKLTFNGGVYQLPK